MDATLHQSTLGAWQWCLRILAGWELMASRGGRGWAGEKSKRFMIVGTKDSVPVGAKSGVVAPVPINTPSLRQEIHGSHAENTGIPSITRSSAGGGWGTVAGASSAGNATDGAGASGKGRGRVGGDRSKGGDDVFTRHFPDLRAGLEQAEKLDAVTKASSKVAPLRKPKPEAAKDQGPSLRPRAMLKPTGSAGGGSAATAAAQAAIKDAVHNRVAEKPKPEEPRRNGPSFADEISSKSRWPVRSQLEGGQTEGGGGGRGGGGGVGGRGAWDRNREGGRGRGGERGRGYDRERNNRDGFQDKDRRNGGWGSDRNASNSRARESIFGSGGHAGMVNTDNESACGTLKPTTTYVRQHGPPPRRASSQSASTPNKAQVSPQQNDEQTSATHQPSSRSSGQSDADPWSATEATKWRTPLSPDEPADTPEASSTPDVSSSQSGSYVRTHGPPRRGGREGAGDDKGYSASSLRPEGDHAAVRESDATGEVLARFPSGGGSSEQSRGGTERESFGNGERNLSGRWKEPAGGLAPPPAPTNTRWKEPKEDSFATRPGTRRWRNGSREESQMGSGRWSRDVGDVGDVGDADSSGSPSDPSPPVQNSSWTDSAGVGWGLQPGEEQEQAQVATDAPQEQLEQADGEPSTSEAVTAAATAATSSEDTVAIVDAAVEVKAPSTAAGDENTTGDSPPFQNSFVPHQTSTAQPVLRTASWEPQLPRGGDAWSAAGHGRDAQGENQGQGQSGAPGATASQPWSDPWGTSSFGLSPTGGEQGSSAIASLLGNNGPVEPRKDRYLPPALRNRTPSEGAQVEASSISTGDQETEATPAALQPDVGSTSLSNQELEMQSAGGRMGASTSGGVGAAKPPLYEQQQPPLEEWQHGRAQPSQLAPEDQSARPREQQLHQRQPQAQHPPQHLHMHDQPQHLKQEYQPPPPSGFSSFQQQDRRQPQMQEPVLRQFQTEHFRSPNYHAQDQGGRSPIPEHVRRRQYPQEHLHRQQYNHVQMHQQQPPQQMHMPQHALQQHSLHQPQHMHPHQQGQHQPPAPLSNQMGQTHHTRQHPGHSQQQQQQQQQQQPPSQGQQHHQQEIGRQISQPQQMLVQQPQQVQQHPPFMGYSDPRARGPGGLGGLPVHNMTQPASYRDMPLQQPGIPPPGTYDFQSPESHHKR